MNQAGEVGRPRLAVNDEGYLVDLATGFVLGEYAPIEGTELLPARAGGSVIH
ncbi:hypothetical protein [Vulcanisaeta distributa]|uniref:hypothetical protein n=1 Tax=Vulcanisaeta distributa TaxID=164451 RepID=UPI000AF59577|nr:hypothetical protein [Vulcanisaeta distributa]